MINLIYIFDLATFILPKVGLRLSQLGKFVVITFYIAITVYSLVCEMSLLWF